MKTLLLAVAVVAQCGPEAPTPVEGEPCTVEPVRYVCVCTKQACNPGDVGAYYKAEPGRGEPRAEQPTP